MNRSDERGPEETAGAPADERAGPRRGGGDRERDIPASLDARQLRRLVGRRVPVPLPVARSRPDGLLRADGRGARGAPPQSVDRRSVPAQRAWRGAAPPGGGCRSYSRRAACVPRGAAEQPRRAGALYALRFSQDRDAPRLLPRAQRARRCAGAHARAEMTRRDAILAEMCLAPIWSLKQAPVLPESVSSGGKPGWIELKQAVPACTACALHKTRAQTVLGVGDENADWLLVGEAPGAEEDRLGEPFVGQAGKLLDNMVAAVRLECRRKVDICHSLQFAPSGCRRRRRPGRPQG